jgi:hypothetical protein
VVVCDLSRDPRSDDYDGPYVARSKDEAHRSGFFPAQCAAPPPPPPRYGAYAVVVRTTGRRRRQSCAR